MKNKIVKWYDKQFRVWVIQIKDGDGNQVGDAIMVYSKREADLVVIDLKKTL